MQVPQAKLDSWVRQYGTNSSSYVLLEGPKSYFTSPGVDGFIAYQVSGGIALIAGDPVCAPQQARGLIRDFTSAMMRPVGAYQVSPAMREAFRAEGFADVQIGKEAIFDLRRFTLAGGKMELVRAATNKARREGVEVSEHHPFVRDAEPINKELREISDASLSVKGNHELGFVLGSLGLERPSAKRYFIARSGNGAGRIEGFVDDPDLLDHPVLARLMRFVFDKVNVGYDFKCFNQRRLSLSMLYAVIAEALRSYAKVDSAAPVYVYGWSLGAGFAIAVGSDVQTRSNWAGVISIGLPKQNQLVSGVGGNHTNLHNDATVLFGTQIADKTDNKVKERSVAAS